MNVQSLKRISDNAMKQLSGRKAMFIPAISVLSFFVVGYTAIDKEAPVLTTTDLKLNYGEVLDLSQLGISDNRDALSDLVVKADTTLLNTHRLGDYRVPVTVSDRSQNAVTQDVIVHVVDEVKPEIRINENNDDFTSENNIIELNVNAPSDITHYIQAYDNADGDLSMFMNVDAVLDTSVLGTQNIHIEVSDASGNIAEESFAFVVSDNEAPTIEWNDSNVLELNLGDTFEARDYASIHDNSTSDDELMVTIDSPIDIHTMGTYETNLIVRDLSGNETKESITVEVKDLSRPELTVSQDHFEISAGDSFDIRSYITAYDELDGDLTGDIEVEGFVNTQAPGDYTLTIYVQDEAGNETSQNVTVTVTSPAVTYSSAGGNGSIVSNGLSKVGSAYAYGSAGPYAFDCSGFTSYVFAQSGISIGRTTYAQYAGGTKVTDIQPGDLLFFNTVGSLGHVGIYIGNGQMVHAGTSQTGVEVTSINSSYWQSTYAGAVRY